MSGRSSPSKLVLKKWARRLVIKGSRLARIASGERLKAGLRILTYHRVADVRGDPFAISPVDFARQMKTLSQMEALEPLDEALEGLGTGRDLRPRIALTFDDGTSDFILDVLPVLTRLHIPATLYVSPARVGERGYMGWDELVSVAKMGVRFGSHGWDHQSFARLDVGEVERQAIHSREVLQDRLGLPIKSLAYPYGTVRDFNEAVKEQVRRAGYRAAFTSVNGINRSSTDRFELRRTKIEQGDDRMFREILFGGLDGWAFIDRYFSALQNRYGNQ
jgi:peptidoglycan/xylan/chitin deacetylase (PgdA/CDA1 family)